MERQPINSVTRLFLLITFCVIYRHASFPVEATTTQELLKGFTATPDKSVSTFQALLSDSTGNYSLGLLRVNRIQLALAVLHVQSSEPLWLAKTTRLARWSETTRLFFNGSLVISDPHERVFWSSNTEGDRILLSNTSNLQILDESHSIILWQSFDFPSDTLVENQNFTSTMSLVSSNGLYSMRLGSDFIGLYAKFNQQSDLDKIYWRHRALQAKAEIVEGQGPIYAVLNSDGFLGMYQNGSVPVDVQAFNSFQQNGSGVRKIQLEPDGNLKGYYWTGSSWITDYQAISDPCELPSSCGSYGLCIRGKGCSCLDNRTDYKSARCASPDKNSGDFCSADSKYWALRRKGVELPFKELMGYEKMGSLDKCESACELNCTCWGVVYSNTSGFCYTIDYPIATLVGVGDETKVGYFKVREGAADKVKMGFRIGVALLFGAILVFGGFVGFGLYRFWRRKRGVNGYVGEEGEVAVGPYKDLASASFRSIELSER